MKARLKMLLSLGLAGVAALVAAMAVPALRDTALPTVRTEWPATGIGGRGAIDLLLPAGPLS